MIEPLNQMFRRLFAHSDIPSVGELIRRAEMAGVGAEDSAPRMVPVDTAVPVEPAPTPPWPQDPYLGVVGGPELVARTAHNKASHLARYSADNAHGEFPISAWGPFDPGQLGHDVPDEEMVA